MGKKLVKAAFLDRDGAMIHDRPGFYLRTPDKLKLYPYTPAALKLLRKAGFKLVIITNQAGIGRGWITHATLAKIHGKLKRLLKAKGVTLDGIYYCPHDPKAPCNCRKPKTHMPLRAARELGLTMKGSVVFGDKRADVDMGRRLGITTVHLKTGHGRSQRAIHGKALKPTYTAKNLLQAARWAVRHADASR